MLKNDLFARYGVSLQRLNVGDIELLRNWRNDPKISQYMNYREHITAEMQVKWFDSINNDNNYYFIVSYNDSKIGMTNIKNIDNRNRCGESGIFIYEDKHLNSDIPFRIACALNDFIFEILDLNFTYGHILKDNKRAIRFNTFMGCRLQENQEELINQSYCLKQEDYLQRRKVILQYLNIL